MAPPRGLAIPAPYQRILKQFSTETYRHGQEGLANHLGASRERISLALNGNRVQSELATDLVNVAEKAVRDDPDLIDRAYTERRREPLLPQMKLAAMIEAETGLPPVLASMLAHAAWKRIVQVSRDHTNSSRVIMG